MIISQVGINLLKSFEGCKLTAYKALPTEQFFTIGYGHYGSDVREGQTITQQQAEDMLKNDVAKYALTVNNCVAVPINQNMFDAMTSLCYNIGQEAFRTSTLIQKLNNGDVQGASNEFDKWVHSGGQVIQGLVVRRQAEKKLFLTPAPLYKPPTNFKYHIQDGDTLTKLSKIYGLSVDDIMKLNPSISNPNKIYVGQVIILPKK